MKNEVIKRGKHEAGFHYRVYLGIPVVKFEWELTDSAIHFYNIADDDANDTHKVAGVCFGKPENDCIITGFQNHNRQKRTNLICYMHNKGIISYLRVGTIRTRTRYLTTQKHAYHLNQFELTTIEMHTGASVLENKNGEEVQSLIIPFMYPMVRIGMYQYPRWGGNHTAPHDVTIKLRI